MHDPVFVGTVFVAERQQVFAQDSTGDDVLLNGTARGNERRRRNVSCLRWRHSCTLCVRPHLETGVSVGAAEAPACIDVPHPVCSCRHEQGPEPCGVFHHGGEVWSIQCMMQVTRHAPGVEPVSCG